jgi:hypothetical protein
MWQGESASPERLALLERERCATGYSGAEPTEAILPFAVAAEWSPLSWCPLLRRDSCLGETLCESTVTEVASLSAASDTGTDEGLPVTVCENLEGKGGHGPVTVAKWSNCKMTWCRWVRRVEPV